ncbi:MAG TPA: NlpC/P60 family protein [Actinophytocola sp.]|uniref:C40 family peptidase n=1 Tax=Actinophytocola sp. TaxID=1872138 RepID=UPI002DBE00EA|nr:NlpC/P60 family protein [Actinophytocola sp.]HEU5473976.1 NlpC/P60 family protein [Actinophytocola sp.]
MSLSPVPALAQPEAPAPPTTASEALKQYQDLSGQASKVNEDLLAARNELVNRQADLDKATADLANAQQSEAAAKAQEEQFRGTVDALASASFQGARFSSLSALLTGDSQQEFLDRASALNMLATENAQALQAYSSAVEQAATARQQATDAQNRSQEAKAKAEALVGEIDKAKADLDARVSDAEKAYARLSGKDKQDLVGPDDHGVYLAPAGAAQAAVQTALDQVGDRYVYGAEGPDQFDCSGLTMYAYRAVNVGLPHSSRAQYTLGKPVKSGEWIAGDLLFYGGSAGSIHHVAMYIGNGKLVHASTSGVPVKVADAPYGGGRDYLGARRIVG